MDSLEQEVKSMIIEALDLEDVSPGDIETTAPLFGDGLGLDSIDALELGVAIKKRFDISFAADDKDTRRYFFSVQTLADYIRLHRQTVS